MGLQELRAIISKCAPEHLREDIERLGIIKATVHTPVYTMHKFWARRPWIVFRKLILLFTRPGDIILDPFAGGGVTLVEGLITRRRVIAIDLNPLAVKIMKYEVMPLNVELYRKAVKRLKEILEPIAAKLYKAKCPKCGRDAIVIWTEYETITNTPLRLRIECHFCGFKGTKKYEPEDLPPPPPPPEFRRVMIPPGDKTNGLLKRGIRYFDELFTKRNLYMILRVKEEIEKLEGFDETIKSYLLFTLSSTLKWASKMSHLRGDIVEGWALHAYWIYPKYLEINVWEQFLNRAEAVIRGKQHTNMHIGLYAKEAGDFKDLIEGKATYMILQRDARRLLLPNESVDVVITDPPYGGNVNYAELSDYFLWLFREFASKESEIIINATRNFTIYDYEKGLEEVFKECYRVLKPSKLLISTFNSKDSAVVGAFMLALKNAGFTFLGASPQPYLEAYETTFHAMQIGAMSFDYIFFYQKVLATNRKCDEEEISLEELRKFIAKELDLCKKERCTEREYRARVYPVLMKYFNQCNTMEEVLQASRIFETIIKNENDYFEKVRKAIIEARRNGNKR
ncbi:MAG: DNA methyltransferase [Thermosphaera aggregans]|jgi:DNA modification methylase|uniref:DNA methyltransferase n=1 Tax=Thermosphaera aggregans TaxID=54254 RepID=UPI003C00A10D